MQTLAVGSGQRHWLAEAEAIGLQEPRLAGTTVVLVGCQHHRQAGAPEDAGQVMVEWADAGPGVDEHQDHLRCRHGAFGLGLDPAGERVGGGALEAGGIDGRECEVAQLHRGLAAVAGDAGRIVDDRQRPAGQAIEQRRLADVGTADDDHRQGHRLIERLCRRGY